MSDAHVRKAQTFLEERTRCKDCGLPRVQLAIPRGTAKRGAMFEQPTPETHCVCPPKVDPGMRSIPYDRTTQ